MTSDFGKFVGVLTGRVAVMQFGESKVGQHDLGNAHAGARRRIGQAAVDRFPLANDASVFRTAVRRVKRAEQHIAALPEGIG